MTSTSATGATLGPRPLGKIFVARRRSNLRVGHARCQGFSKLASGRIRDAIFSVPQINRVSPRGLVSALTLLTGEKFGRRHVTNYYSTMYLEFPAKRRGPNE